MDTTTQNGTGKTSRLPNHHGQVLDLFEGWFAGESIRGVEVGTFYADLSKAILHELPNVKTLWTIDPWEHREGTEFEATSRDQKCFDEMRTHAINALSEFGERAQILNMPSDDAFFYLRNEEVDFVWIDGDHTHDAVERDILNAMKIVRKGGILGGHDFATIEPVLNKLFKPGDLVQGHDLTWWVKQGVEWQR